MSHVRTRGGVFGPGGYGGGIFDGSMAVSGVGSVQGSGYEQAAAGLGGGLGDFSAATADSRVRRLQELLNIDMVRFGCQERLTVDGLIGTYSGSSRTCSALKWLIQAATITGRPLSDALVQHVTASQDLFERSCNAFSLPAVACPALSTLQPAAPPPGAPGPGAGVPASDVVVWQQAINPVLYVFGYQTIPENGVVDGVLCGALKAITDRLVAGADAGLPAAAKAYVDDFRSLASFAGTMMETACAAVPIPWVQPGSGSGVVIPAPGPAPQPPPSAGGPCRVEGGQTICDCRVTAGDMGIHIAWLQQRINEALAAASYEQIPVTGTYDAKTCGAIFELGGSFEPGMLGICDPDLDNGEWIVPLRCPDMQIPRKLDESGAPKPKIATAAIVGGLLAAAGVAGLYAWKKARG